MLIVFVAQDSISVFDDNFLNCWFRKLGYKHTYFQFNIVKSGEFLMSYIEIDWELADKIYAREEDKILEDDKKRKQEKAKDCQSRGIMANTTSYRVGMRRIDMEKFERLKDARINADWQVVYKAKENITDRVFANIVTRLNQTLSTHIGRSVSIYGSQEEYNKTKAILLAKAKKELEIGIVKNKMKSLQKNG